MISSDLGHLADWCLGEAAKGCGLHPDRVAHLAKVLLDLCHQARRLENLPIDDAQLTDHDDAS